MIGSIVLVLNRIKKFVIGKAKSNMRSFMINNKMGKIAEIFFNIHYQCEKL